VTAFTEPTVEAAALEWLEGVGWAVAHGPDIAPDMPAAERDDYGEVVLARRLRAALARLNPQLPAEALEDAFRKLNRPEGADLVQRNRFGTACSWTARRSSTERRRARSGARRRGRSTSTIPRATTGWRSTSSRSPRASTCAARTWCCS